MEISSQDDILRLEMIHTYDNWMIPLRKTNSEFAPEKLMGWLEDDSFPLGELWGLCSGATPPKFNSEFSHEK